MKKISLVMMALALSMNLAACGGGKAETQAIAAPGMEAPEAEASDEEREYTLDYDSIAAWVDGGFIGIDAGAPVVMALDKANEFAIIIFGDNSDMTAVSFVGEITYEGDLATITDETNELSLTFGVTRLSEDTVELDMGDIGKATIRAATTEETLDTIKTAIDNYKHEL